MVLQYDSHLISNKYRLGSSDILDKITKKMRTELLVSALFVFCRLQSVLSYRQYHKFVIRTKIGGSRDQFLSLNRLLKNIPDGR